MQSVGPAQNTIMTTGEIIIRWTIRVAMLLYTLSICGQLATASGQLRLPNSSNFWRINRWLWTLGCIVFVSHVIAAFHFHHHWDHAHAIEQTARETEAKIGWAFGEGIYFSYLFTLLWLADVTWWWVAPDSYRKRPTWLAILIHCYLFFIAINGTVVFEAGVTRPGGIIVSIIFALLITRFLLTSRTANAQKRQQPNTTTGGAK